MKTIKKFKVLSVARIFGMIFGGIYLFFGLLVNSASLFNVESLSEFDMLGFGSGILATFLVVLLVGCLAFAFGALLAWLYNFCAYLVGGISYEEVPYGYVEKPTPKKIEPVKPIPQEEVNSILASHKEQSKDTYSSNSDNFLS